jgi:hypothetical protein
MAQESGGAGPAPDKKDRSGAADGKDRVHRATQRQYRTGVDSAGSPRRASRRGSGLRQRCRADER